jgi:hypothetical protein
VNISFKGRRERMIAAAALILAIGGLAAAVPAHAFPSAGASADAVGTPTITDWISPGGVTGKDAIVNCTTSTTTIGGTSAVTMPVGCLNEYNEEWVKVTWSGTGVSTELIQQDDGNFVLYAGNGKTWGAATRYVDNPTNGPGCVATFQGDADLVVYNCAGTAVWASGTHTYPNAVLAFQADGNLVIYSSATGSALWSTKTN